MELVLKLVFVFERSIFGVELVLEPPSFVCYCWRKRLDTEKIGRIQTGRASNTKDLQNTKIQNTFTNTKMLNLFINTKTNIFTAGANNWTQEDWLDSNWLNWTCFKYKTGKHPKNIPPKLYTK